jgi:hypothetical protein
MSRRDGAVTAPRGAGRAPRCLITRAKVLSQGLAVRPGELVARDGMCAQEQTAPASGYACSPDASRWEVAMARCETCGNDYDKAFQVSMNGTTHTFDSFECAIHALAPTCENCGIRIVGHGLEKDGTFFCCEHCAEVVGVTGLRDRISAAA